MKITGAGHFPDSVNVVKRTFILGEITINAGADNLCLEGLYINGNINYQSDASINYVKVVRCRFNSALFRSNSVASKKNDCSFEECFINGDINFYDFGVNLQVKHCVIKDVIYSVEGALIDGNILLQDHPLRGVQSSLVKNNIFNRGAFYAPSYDVKGNQFFNNLFVKGSIDFGNNSYSNNYTDVPQANIFVNQAGVEINYEHDYHLKTPATYLGTDGTQVGLYGGITPFKEYGLPSNPQVIKKEVATETDANGNLQINFTVKAQDR